MRSIWSGACNILLTVHKMSCSIYIMYINDVYVHVRDFV